MMKLHLTAALTLSLTLGVASAQTAQERTEILWDTWGVPHIYATSDTELFRAFGWAQARNHGDLILRLYGQARGRAAEYWGEKYLPSDRLVRTIGTNRMGHTWHALQTPEFKQNLKAFADGINAYAAAHPQAISADVRRVLPVTAQDVMAHNARAMFVFLSLPGDGATRLINARAQFTPGSNGWAIGPKRSASGHAMLLANPHLQWGDLFLFFESQLTAPGYSTYGTTLVGTPVNAIAFNDRLGWTHTVNTIDAFDAYTLTPSGDGYLLDGQERPFITTNQTLRVRQADGTLREEPLEVRWSVHGPVIAERDGKPVAVRVGGLTQFPVTNVLKQWWDMGKASNLQEFQAALKQDQLPLFNVIYADADGHTMQHYAGRIPDRPRGSWLDWYGFIPGDSTRNLWWGYHTYGDRPTLTDPQTGWVQNANEAPWMMTLPAAPDPARYDADIAPPLGVPHLRAQSSAGMLAGDESITFDELLAYKHNTKLELAGRVLPDLIAAARQYGGQNAKAAADVLAAWDGRTDADSRGALLFVQWAMANAADIRSGQLFAQPWNPQAFLNTPSGLKDPQKAAATLEAIAGQVLKSAGRLDVPWGDVARFRFGNVDVPGNGADGALGAFRVMSFVPQPDGRLAPVHGDTYVAAVEFGPQVKAKVITTYGNATQPGSPHAGDQLKLASQQLMRDAWLTRAEVEQNLKERETLD